MQSSQKPILVTGATGFLASHCVKQLLEYGYKVRGTVRSLTNKTKNQFLYGLVPEKSANLELVEADLLKPETWGPAVEGVDYILHVASPFPLEAPKHEDMLIKPAVEGTLSVLQAAVAKGAKKVVITSSVAAVQYGNENKVCGPEDWSVEKKCPPYQKSKLKAERAAWKFWEENKDKLEVVTILPGFIIGELFTYAGGTSEKTVKDMLTGKMPGLPDWSIGVIDVRDVAEAHIKALFSTTSNGKRYMVSGETVSMKQMSQVLRDEYGKYGYKVTKNSVPNCLIKFMALFRKDAEALKADLGKQRRYNNERTEKELDMKFRSSTACFKDMADSLIRLGAVPNRLPKSEVGR